MNSSETSPHALLQTEKQLTDRKVHRRLALVVIALGLLVAGRTFFFGQASHAADDHSAPPAPPPPKVTVAQVEESTLVDQRELLGRVDSMETVEVRPRVSGHIDEVHLQAGQFVKKGDLLFQIDPRWYKAQFDLSQAAVERAKAHLSITERDARRANELLASHAVSVEEADTKSSLLAEARAELLAAQAALETARLDLDYTQVRAPISGRINRAYVTAGNLVSGSPGGATLLTTIVSTGDMYVYADVDEATLLTFNQLVHDGRLKMENGGVLVDMALSNETNFSHHGHVESTDNRLDMSTGSLVLRMVFPNPDGKLLPGLSARVRLPVSGADHTLFVNEKAIGTNQSQKFVLTVAADNTVAYRSVKLGPLVDGRRVIRDGIQAGDRVIVNGLQRVSAGMAVTPETASVAMK
jgi:RND family efflux transporter MFP subunit